jgi:hypothetical protein
MNTNFLIKGGVFVISSYFGLKQIIKMYVIMDNMNRNNIIPMPRTRLGVATGIYSGTMLIGASYAFIFSNYLDFQIRNIYCIIYGMSFSLNVLTYALLPKEAKYSLL